MDSRRLAWQDKWGAAFAALPKTDAAICLPSTPASLDTLALAQADVGRAFGVAESKAFGVWTNAMLKSSIGECAQGCLLSHKCHTRASEQSATTVGCSRPICHTQHVHVRMRCACALCVCMLCSLHETLFVVSCGRIAGLSDALPLADSAKKLAPSATSAEKMRFEKAGKMIGNAAAGEAAKARVAEQQAAKDAVSGQEARMAADRCSCPHDASQRHPSILASVSHRLWQRPAKRRPRRPMRWTARPCPA